MDILYYMNTHQFLIVCNFMILTLIVSFIKHCTGPSPLVSQFISGMIHTCGRSYNHSDKE